MNLKMKNKKTNKIIIKKQKNYNFTIFYKGIDKKLILY